MVTFTLADRLILRSSLPVRGGAVSFLIKADIIEKIKLTTEEIEEFEIKDLEGGGIKFNKLGGAAIFEIGFSETEFQFIKTHFKDLDDKKQLTDQTYKLFKMFC